MDPNKALSDLLEQAAVLLDKYEEGELSLGDEDEQDAVAELCESVQNLDEWIKKGGFLPQPWQPVPQAEPEPRTLQQLAKEAVDVQNACNLTGVAQSFARAMLDLRRLYPNEGTAWYNKHFITCAWVDKLCALAGMQGNDQTVQAMSAHSMCDRVANPDEEF